jgi:hypothetical protein
MASGRHATAHAVSAVRGRSMALVAVVAMLFSTALVFTATSAAFTDTTSNTGNQWATGTVVLTDDHQPAGTLFSLSDVKPGDTGFQCITVTYSGSLAATVRLYIPTTYTGYGTGLDQYLTLAIEEGGDAGNCATFVGGTSLAATQTLAVMAGAHNNFATGLASNWTINAGGGSVTRADKVTWALPAGTGAAAQGLTASNVSLTWEAQST